MNLNRLTGPASEPASLAEAKAHLRVDLNDDDALIGALISTAREWVEAQTARALMTQTWRMSMDVWPKGDAITLVRAPVQAIIAVRTIGTNGGATVWPSSAYSLAIGSEPSRLLKIDGDWPGLDRMQGGVEIDLTCGYGNNPSDVPQALRRAVLMCTTHLYERRGDAADGGLGDIQALLAPFRVWRL